MAKKYVHVKYARTDDRVALWERSDEHPEGEAFIGPDFDGVVGDTALVREKIAEGSIVKVGEAVAPEEARRGPGRPPSAPKTE